MGWFCVSGSLADQRKLLEDGETRLPEKWAMVGWGPVDGYDVRDLRLLPLSRADRRDCSLRHSCRGLWCSGSSHQPWRLRLQIWSFAKPICIEDHAPPRKMKSVAAGEKSG